MRLAALANISVGVALGAPVAYLYLIALASLRIRSTRPAQHPRHRFAIAIPAHNEAGVIGASVAALRKLDYPPELFDVHIVADHCTDRTVEIARTAGSTVHERKTGERDGKGAALRWLFERVLVDDTAGRTYDAVVVFDADTRPAADFLRVMDARLAAGDAVIQGQHRIGNPQDGWVPALTWAMFIIDNRLQNLGRSALGWSAKNMGDSICFRADVLRRMGWGDGLTEDYAFRQQLLIEGVKIAYEPGAVGYGEAPLTWRTAAAQRTRWLRGTRDASRRYARQLLIEGIKRRDAPLLDGALQASLPSYSSLSVLTIILWLVTALAGTLRPRGRTERRAEPASGWAVLASAMLAYPLLGLMLERAPLRAYVAIGLGPVFIVWRTWLAMSSRLHQEVIWVRTPRRAERLGGCPRAEGRASK